MVPSGRVRRGEDEPPGARAASRFEDAERLADVDVERSEWIRHRVRDPGSRRQMDDGVGALDRPGDRVPIGQRRPDQLVRHAVEIGELAHRKVVEDTDAIATLDEDARDRRPDEACPADDEDGSVQRR
jgi:hypothetical protein